MFRGATRADLDRILQIYDRARSRMAETGNPTGWAKTQHNEAAPAQHELAPIYAQVNVAVDHNQMIMETLKKVAGRHGLTCLLHEKPFKGVNGSGKHNNWSLTTDDGINMLNPGDTPHENIQFLLVLATFSSSIKFS